MLLYTTFIKTNYFFNKGEASFMRRKLTKPAAVAKIIAT